MSPDTPQAAQVRAAIETLVQSASAKDFAILDRIYHDDMQIFMFGPDGTVHQSDKAQFKAHVIARTNEAGKPDVWAKFHLVTADEKNGHVVISRRVNLTGEMQIVTLSIDLIFEDDRWQITREVIATS